MKQSKKRLAAAALAVTLCASLAGCSSRGSSSSQQSAPSQSTGSTSTPSSAAPSTSSEAIPEMEGNLYLQGLPIVKDPVKYSVMVSKSALDKSSSFSEKEILKEAEKATNVQFDWMEVPASGWGDRVNIVFASGDLPDAIFGNVDIVPNCRALMEVTGDMLSKYMPNLNAFLEKNPLIKAKITAPDGKVYSLPTGEDSSPWSILSDALYINTEWLTKLGASMPTTTDEFYDVLVKAKEAGDLNGNGAVDEFPLASASWGASPSAPCSVPSASSTPPTTTMWKTERCSLPLLIPGSMKG